MKNVKDLMTPIDTRGLPPKTAQAAAPLIREDVMVDFKDNASQVSGSTAASAATTPSALAAPNGRRAHIFSGAVHQLDLRILDGSVQRFSVEQGHDFNLKLHFDHSRNSYECKDALQPARMTFDEPYRNLGTTGGAYTTYVFTWPNEALRNGPRPFRIHMVSLYDEPYPIEVDVVPATDSKAAFRGPV